MVTNSADCLYFKHSIEFTDLIGFNVRITGRSMDLFLLLLIYVIFVDFKGVYFSLFFSF